MYNDEEYNLMSKENEASIHLVFLSTNTLAGFLFIS